MYSILGAIAEADYSSVRRSITLSANGRVGSSSIRHYAIISAIDRGDISSVQQYVRHGRMDMDTEVHCGSLLQRAIARNRRDILEFLVNCGASLNKPYKCGLTPLMFETVMGNDRGVRLLLDVGVNIWTTDVDGLSAFHLAAALGNRDVLCSYMRPPPVGSFEYHALWCLKQLGHPFTSSKDFARVLQPYLHRPPWVTPSDVRDVRDKYGRNAVDIATLQRQHDAVSLLVSFCEDSK